VRPKNKHLLNAKARFKLSLSVVVCETSYIADSTKLDYLDKLDQGFNCKSSQVKFALL